MNKNIEIINLVLTGDRTASTKGLKPKSGELNKQGLRPETVASNAYPSDGDLRLRFT